jgi:ketosteroid isomerase-like protein
VKQVKQTVTSRAVVAAIVVGVAWGVYAFWPTDERRVRRRLDALEELLNERPRDGLGMVTHTAQLVPFFTEDVVLQPSPRAGPVSGRDRLIALASRVPSSGAGEYSVDFVDISVQVTGDTATSRMTATVTLRADPAEPATVDAREVDVQWRREADWRIARITAIEPLQRPEP